MKCLLRFRIQAIRQAMILKHLKRRPLFPVKIFLLFYTVANSDLPPTTLELPAFRSSFLVWGRFGSASFALCRWISFPNARFKKANSFFSPIPPPLQQDRKIRNAMLYLMTKRILPPFFRKNSMQITLSTGALHQHEVGLVVRDRSCLLHPVVPLPHMQIMQTSSTAKRKIKEEKDGNRMKKISSVDEIHYATKHN